MTKPKIIESRQIKTELSEFASRFHQDWGYQFDSADELADAYIANLSGSRRAALKQELRVFLDAHKSASRQRLTKLWSDLSGGGASIHLRAILERIHERL